MELEELKNIGNSIGFFKVEELNIILYWKQHRIF